MIKRLIYLLISLIFVFKGYGADEKFFNSLSGGQVVATATMTIEDDKLPITSPEWATIDTTLSVTNLLVFELDRNSKMLYSGSGDVTVTVSVDLYTADGTMTTKNEVLTFHFGDLPNATQAIDFVKYTGYHKMVVTIVTTSLNCTSSSCDWPPMRLYGEIDIVRTYLFDCNSGVMGLSTCCLDSDSTEITFNWSTVQGADEYEFEYSFYDQQSEVGQILSNGNSLSNMPGLFRHNSTRVVVSGQSYKINLLFPKGYILSRIRGVHRDWDNSRKTSIWAYGTPISTAWHESNLNWQTTTTFAEEGKNIPSIKYFDGALKERQSVTLSHTLNMTIAGMSIYDRQGRPAMSVMPAPTFDSKIHFDPLLAAYDNTTPYSYDHFDKNVVGCGPSSDPMSSVDGAARYYSTSNPMSTTGIHQYIPDSKGYPFSVTEFTPDATGRISRQGGVGEEFQLGNGHETKYIYGKPTQWQLDRLFGNDVGFFSHYFKNLVVDPNGQVSVSYLDMHGRTIATCLAGDTPSEVSDLPNQTPVSTVVDDLLDHSQRASITQTMSLTVANAGDNTFNYLLTPASYHPDCVSDDICYDCLYDVVISISGDCDNAFNGGSVWRDTLSNVTASMLLDTTCAVSPGLIDTNFILNLPVGGYVVTREIYISHEAKKEYAEHFLTQSACVPSYEDLVDEFQSHIDFSGCGLTCDECMADIPEVDSILYEIQQETGEIPSKQDTIEAHQRHDAALADCEDLCAGQPSECSRILRQMEWDMSPGGQYWSDEVLSSGESFLKLSSFSFMKEDGIEPDSILKNGVLVAPSDLTKEEFAFYFQEHPYWSQTLVLQHPEYTCYKNYCNSLGLGIDNSFDSLLNAASSYQDAILAGLIDPVTGHFLDSFFLEAGALYQDSINYFLDSFIVSGANHCGEVIPLPVFLDHQANCGSLDTIPFGQGVGGSPEMEWEALRAIYLGMKAHFKQKVFDCTPTLPTPPAGVTFQIRLLDADDVDKYADEGSIHNQHDENMDLVINECEATCILMAEGWMSKLSSCTEGLTQSQLNEMRSRLIMVCQSGCDLDHPFGASTTPNAPILDGGDSFSSFEDVIRLYLPNYGDCDTSCYEEITYPGPYNRPAYLGPQTTPMEDCLSGTCVCDNLNSLLDSYNSIDSSQCVQENIIGYTFLGYISDKKLYISDTKMNWASAQASVSSVGGELYHIDDVSENYFLAQLIDSEAFIGLSDEANEGEFIWTNGKHLTISWLDLTTNTTYNDVAVMIPSSGSWELHPSSYSAKVILEIKCHTKPSSFSDYLNTFSDTHLGDAQIDTLMKYCGMADSIPVSHLPSGISIPPYLECNTCKTCDEIESLVNLFNSQICQNGDLPFYDRLLSRFLNKKLGFNLTPGEYSDFMDKCAEVTSPEIVVLCPGTYSNEPDTSCYADLMYQAELQAFISYNSLIDSVRQAFYNSYLAYCDSSLSEIFTVESAFQEYQYTLYYYDQSGLLVKTIPPAGVHVLAQASIDSVVAHRNNNSLPPVYANHSLATKYAYNSLNQVVRQVSPDGGVSQFWYDRVGRLVVSQNAKQRNSEIPLFSYTKYDALGRVIEVGELQNSQMTNTIARNQVLLDNWIGDDTEHYKRYVTRTYYDSPLLDLPSHVGGIGQINLRSRVAATSFVNWLNSTVDTVFDYATHYSYDPVGNVDVLYQDFPELESLGNRFKRIDYDFDLVSGKVNSVIYQKDKPDQFVHHYFYDSDNKLVEVTTSFTDLSSNAYLQESDARYEYYLHGPLARVELGDNRVQGVDYAYNLQGWMKVVNRNYLLPRLEMGKDGYAPEAGVNLNRYVARDAYGYALNYFDGDYQPINQASNVNPEINYASTGFGGASSDLFNGNIRNMSVQISGFGGKPNGYAYSYDQLHRIKKMETWNNVGPYGWDASGAALQTYGLDINYDPNGNILSLTRKGDEMSNSVMDDLTYSYTPGTNLLQSVQESVPNATYANDFDGTTNYQYDPIGNLFQSNENGFVSNIRWTPYGKVRAVYNSLQNTFFGYDAAQNRVKKAITHTAGDTTTTYYVRDAQGNTMAVYRRHRLNSKDSLTWVEQYLYGSSRLGQVNPNVYLGNTSDEMSIFDYTSELNIGWKRYELTNHLGNVLAVISDRKIPLGTPSGCSCETISGYNLLGQIGQKCIYVSTGTANWANAKVAASSIGAELLSIHSQAENDLVKNANLGAWVLFGLNDIATEGNLEWSDNSSFDYSSTMSSSLPNQNDRDFGIFNAWSGEWGMIHQWYSNKYLIQKTCSGGQQSQEAIAYNPVILSATDYYPFGLEMPGRSLASNSYRFGFNGKEKDADGEWGTLTHYDYGFRIYNPAVGRFLSVDPLFSSYPFYTPYQFASNCPIGNIDLDGLEAKVAITYMTSVGTKIDIPSDAEEIVISTGDLEINGLFFGNMTADEFSKNFPAGTLGQFTIDGVTYRAAYTIKNQFAGYINENGDRYDQHKYLISNYQSVFDGTIFEHEPLIPLLPPVEDFTGGVLRDAIALEDLISSAGFFATLSGKSLKMIAKKAKDVKWKKAKLATGNGWKYLDENGVERIRYRYSKKGKFLHENDGYIRWKDKFGNFLDKNGKVVLDPETTSEWQTMTEKAKKAAKENFHKATHINIKDLN